jgi:putative flippase GtrA
MPGSLPHPQNGNLTARSFVTFLFVGGFATGLQYVLALLFFYLLGVPVALASTLGYALSAVANYLLNARLTFRSTGAHRQTGPRFIVVAGSGLLLNYILLSYLTSLGLHVAAAQILTTLSVILWNYFINGLWTFRPAKG